MTTIRTAFLFSCFVFVAYGSIIELTSSPSSISPFSSTFTLRCSLKDTASTSGSLVGRDVLQTPDDAQLVATIIVTRNHHEVVASVSSFAPAKAFVDQPNLQVSGHVFQPNSGDREAYLELTWTAPSAAQQGTYTCEVNGIESMGHSVVYSKQYNVNVTEEMGLSDVITFLRDLKGENDALKNEINDMKQKEEHLTADINDLKMQDANLKQELEVLQACCHDNQNNGGGNTNPGHIESGFIDCDNFGDDTESHHTAQFSTPYDIPPVVHMSYNDIYYFFGAAGHENTLDYHYSLVLGNVSTDSFDMYCKDWRRGDNGFMIRQNVSWIAFPQ